MSEIPAQQLAPAVPAPAEAAPPHAWHKLLIALFLTTRGIRIEHSLEGDLGGDRDSVGWTVVWAVVALGIAAFAVSEWEILRESKWRMRPVQWICMGLFHIGFAGFVAYLFTR